MAGSLLLSRVLGLLRDVVVSALFGFSLDNDCLNLALVIPDTLFMLIAGGGLSSAFIPIFSEFIHTDREKEAWDLFSVVVTFCSVIVLGLISIAWIFAGPIALFFAEDKKAIIHEKAADVHDLLPRITELARILVPAQFAFLIGSLLIATLYSRNRFVVPGLAPNVYNVGLIAGAFLGYFGHIGVAGVAWGALIGAMIGNLLMPTVAMLRLGGHFRPSLALKTPGVSKFFRLLGPVVFGFSLPSVAQLISQKFASPYFVGANTVVKYSNNLMQAPAGIFGQSLALAIFPVLAQFYAQDRMDLYCKQIEKTLRTVVFLSVPAAIFMGTLAPQLVNVIYGYGKANSPEELANFALFLRIYSVGIVAWCVQPVLMRGFFSIHRTLEPIIWSTGVTGFFISMLWLTGKTGPLTISLEDSFGPNAGFYAIPWITNLSFVILVFILYPLLQRKVGNLNLPGLISTFGKSLVAGVPMALVAYGLGAVMPAHLPKALNILAFVFVLFPVPCGIYMWITSKMKMPECEYFERGMAKFRNKTN